jgi:signal transduction histidine kinase
MNYRVKLLILVAGVCLLTMTFPAILFYLRGLATQETGHFPIGRFLRMAQWIDEELPREWRNGAPESALHTLPEGEEVIVTDSKGNIVFATIPGFHKGEVIGTDELYESLSYEPEFNTMFIPVLEEGEVVGIVISRVPRRPGKVSLLALRLEGPIPIMSFVIVAATILIVLVTRSLRKGIDRLERATSRVANGDLEFELLPHGRDEIAALTRSFESMRKALKEEQAKRSRFLMAVSHDLKTPLTAIKGYLEAIQDGLAEDPETLKHHLTIIGEKSGVLERRINELIDYVKMSTGQWQLLHHPIRMHHFLSELGKVFASDARVFHRHFECSIDLPEDLELPGDEGLLTRALDNLFHNALRYTREGDTIHLHATQERGDIVITFQDSGMGVAEEEIERIFEPFYRTSGSRREAGFGLGLSTVRSILSAHGWSIKAVSPPGQGLKLIIRAGHAVS